MRGLALGVMIALAACSHSSGTDVVTKFGQPVPTTPPDVPAAEAAIRHAYDTWANPNVTTAERTAASEVITDPAEIAFAKEMSDGNLAQAAQVRFVVDAIRFSSDTSAEVDFHILYGDGPSPVMPGLLPRGGVPQKG